MSQTKRDEIAARAYTIWEAEGRPADRAEEHWRRAEHELAAEAAQPQMGTAPERAGAPYADAPSGAARAKEKAPAAAKEMVAPGEVIEATRKRKTLRARSKDAERRQN